MIWISLGERYSMVMCDMYGTISRKNETSKIPYAMEWRDMILSDIVMHESLSNIVQHRSSLAVENLGSRMYLC